MQRFQKYSPEAICKQFAEQVPHGFHKRLVIVGDANVTMDYTEVGKKRKKERGEKKATIERAHTRTARFSLSLSLFLDVQLVDTSAVVVRFKKARHWNDRTGTRTSMIVIRARSGFCDAEQQRAYKAQEPYHRKPFG